MDATKQKGPGGFLSIENRVRDFLLDHIFELSLACLLLISAVIRIHMAPLLVGPLDDYDYQDCLLPWVNKYRQYSFLGALEWPLTDYYELYNLFLNVVARLPVEPWIPIFTLSFITDYLCAYVLYKSLLVIGEDLGMSGAGEEPSIRQIGAGRMKRIAALSCLCTLLTPMTFMNSGLWKQCESVYGLFCLLSLYYMLRDRYTLSFLHLGIAFSFKLQAVFFFPFYLILYIARKRHSIFCFLWVPLVFFLAGLPAVLSRRGLRSTYLTYLLQTGDQKRMSYLTPSIYHLGMMDDKVFLLPAICLTLALLVGVALFVCFCREGLDSFHLYYLAAWSAQTVFLFLPRMHERYDYVALFILTGFVLLFRRRLLFCIILMHLVTLMNYASYFWPWDGISLVWRAIIYNVAYIFISADLAKSLLSAHRRSIERAR